MSKKFFDNQANIKYGVTLKCVRDMIITCIQFINTWFKFYWLDSCHYFSYPRLSWDAMLKMTGIKLEKIPETDKYLFIEKGLRGGVSYIDKKICRSK